MTSLRLPLASLSVAARAGLFAVCVALGASGCPADADDGDGVSDPDAGVVVDPCDACGDDEDCVDGACVPVACTLGSDGCGCDAGACDGDLVCNADDHCEADTACDLGSEGCSCDAGACDGDLVCIAGADGDVCAAQSACDQGTVGCDCNADLSCDGGAGIAVCNRSTFRCDAVVDDSDSPGVVSLACFTPCSQDVILADGTFRFCGADGLIDGCVGTLSCVEGSCVAEGEAPRTCSVPADCPSFQACVSGRCLSNCSLDSECPDDAICNERVCRQLCSSDTSSCGSGLSCSTFDGTDGVCLPQAVSTLSQPTTPSPRFTVDTETLSFTNNKTSGQVIVSNTGTRSARFTVSRVEHTEIDASGRTLVRDGPLFWLRLAVLINGVTEVAATRATTVSFDLAAGESAAVVVSDVDNDALDVWDGRIGVTGEGLGSTSVWLDYATLPEGQWTGTLHSFINFDDRLIDDWLTAMRGTSRTAKVSAARLTQNALLTQWTEFRTNPLYVLQEWEAVLQSTTTG